MIGKIEKKENYLKKQIITKKKKWKNELIKERKRPLQKEENYK